MLETRLNPVAAKTLIAVFFWASVSLAQASAQATALGTSSPPAAAQPDASAAASSPTNQPLAVQSNEGFWGHLNPLARKKWVNRQLNPVKDRLNELDELSASNAREIKDVDARAQAGIQHAQSTADAASQEAGAASGVAAQAQQTSQQSAWRTQQLGSTVAGLDMYQEVSQTEIRFRPGQVALNAKAKDALDGIAGDLQHQKGYLIEIEGFSSAKGQSGIQASQHLADSVARYLVEQREVPVYRIRQAALGHADAGTLNSTAASNGNVVYVTLVHNSLAALNSPVTSAGSPIGATQQPGSQATSESTESKPSAKQ